MKLGRSLGRTPNPFFPVLSVSRHWLGKLALDNVPRPSPRPPWQPQEAFTAKGVKEQMSVFPSKPLTLLLST